jgi:hypothetical protein
LTQIAGLCDAYLIRCIYLCPGAIEYGELNGAKNTCARSYYLLADGMQNPRVKIKNMQSPTAQVGGLSGSRLPNAYASISCISTAVQRPFPYSMRLSSVLQFGPAGANVAHGRDSYYPIPQQWGAASRAARFI